VEFWKMHGAGNDFIIVDNREHQIALDKKAKAELAEAACHRHFGIGADGMIFTEHSSIADIKMTFYNMDGSEATMCGNGIRCFTKYLYDKGIVSERTFAIETGDGVKTVNIIESAIEDSQIEVEMGKWDNNLIEFDIHVPEHVITLSFLHMGVPHSVCFVEKGKWTGDMALDDLTLRFGPLIEKNPVFKEGTNVNFVEVLDNSHIKMSTWERGAGKTLACGTGACSSVIAANRLKGLDNSIMVEMPGGTVRITIMEDDRVFMQGPARLICKGIFFR